MRRRRKLKGHSASVWSVAFSCDGTRVVSGSKDKSICVWDASMGKLERILEGHSEPVLSVAFSRDGTRVISGSRDSSVRVWNMNTSEMDPVLGHSGWVRSVAFSPDGIQLVSSSFDRSVRIMTGDVTSLPASKSVTLPDGSTATHIIPGEFQILAPGEEEVSLSWRKEWILTDPPMEPCPIPPDFRGFSHMHFLAPKHVLDMDQVLFSLYTLNLHSHSLLFTHFLSRTENYISLIPVIPALYFILILTSTSSATALPPPYMTMCHARTLGCFLGKIIQPRFRYTIDGYYRRHNPEFTHILQ